jgi:dTDP-4-amino-4,6-dideoxygalactose transaminase
MVDAVAGFGAAVRFYAVDEHLNVANGQWLEQIWPRDMIVFIDYFGFNQWSSFGNEARERGAWVVEDACQAMLNEDFCPASHYVICSPRKFVGVPDGGILLAPSGAVLPEPSHMPAPAQWWLDALAASALRAEFDRHGGDRKWYDLFRKTELAAVAEPHRMSELSTLLLQTIDYGKIRRRRRENYEYLARELKVFAILPDLPSGVVPLGFPVRLRDRDGIRGELFASAIYPPIHWLLDGVVPVEFKASHQLASQILTLPCDQRYDESDLNQMVAVIKRHKEP